MEFHHYFTLKIRKLRFLKKKLLTPDHNMSREAMWHHGKASRLGFTLPGFSSISNLDMKINYPEPHFPYQVNGTSDVKIGSDSVP